MFATCEDSALHKASSEGATQQGCQLLHHGKTACHAVSILSYASQLGFEGFACSCMRHHHIQQLLYQ